MAAESAAGGGSNFHGDHDSFGGTDWHEVLPFVLLIVGVVLCIVIVCFLASSWILPGFGRAIQHSLRTGGDDIGKVFDAAGRFVPVMLTRLLAGLLILVMSAPLIAIAFFAVMVAESNRYSGDAVLLFAVLAALVYLPFYLYLWLGLVLSHPIAAVEESSPTQAIARSWELARGHRWQLLWFVLFTKIFSVLGVCACCIGVFLTLPMAEVMQIEAYLALKQGEQYPSWWIGRGGFPEHHPEGWGSDPANTSSAPPIASAPSIPIAPEVPPTPAPPPPPVS